MSQSIVSGNSSPAGTAPVGRIPQGSVHSAGGFVRRYAPSAFVIAGLAGMAYWGHATDWTLPKFSELVGGKAIEEAKWCEDHGVPDAQCIECNAKLHPPGTDFGWCKQHGITQCPFEHPEVIQAKDAGALTDADRDRAKRALALRPRAENNQLCRTHLRRVQFADLLAAERSGVEVTIVERQPVLEAITANAEVGYDETRLANLASRVAGSVRQVRKRAGDQVTKGEVLALVDAAEIGKAKAEYLQALAQERLTQGTLQRLAPLAAQQAIAERQLREAKTLHHEAGIRLLSARQGLVNLGFVVPEDGFGELEIEEVAKRLRFLGIPSDVIASLDDNSTSSTLYPLRASLDGTVIQRNVVEGEVIDTTKALFTIGDVHQMWLTLSVRQDDISLVRDDATVRFQGGERPKSGDIPGRVFWISTEADDRTRTVKVRAELPNDGSLRANTFGTGRIVLRDEKDAVVVPSEAVHWDGCCQIVFVRDRNYFEPGSPLFYHVRKVRIGIKDGDRTEVLAGIAPGEIIASKGSSALTAQLLRSNLGEGCCAVAK